MPFFVTHNSRVIFRETIFQTVYTRNFHKNLNKHDKNGHGYAYHWVVYPDEVLLIHWERRNNIQLFSLTNH